MSSSADSLPLGRLPRTHTLKLYLSEQRIDTYFNLQYGLLRIGPGIRLA